MKKAFMTAAIVVSSYIAAQAQTTRTSAFNDPKQMKAWTDTMRTYSGMKTRNPIQEANYVEALKGFKAYLEAAGAKDGGTPPVLDKKATPQEFRARGMYTALHGVDSLLNRETKFFPAPKK